MMAEQDQFFTKIYLDRRKPLLEYAESVLHNHAIAEEVVQQAFEIGWRKIEDFQNCPNPEGWIFKSVKFVISNVESRLRTERRVIAFMDEYRRRSCLIGKEVSVSVGDESFNGTAVDIDENARLIVRLPSGETRVLGSGEARAKL